MSVRHWSLIVEQLLAFLRQTLGSSNVHLFEDKLRDFLDQFALVPKHEYQAHLEKLETLERQVADLEARLHNLEG